VHLRPPVPPGQVAPLIATADAAVILYFPLTHDYLHALPNRFFLPVAAGLPLIYPESLQEIRALAREHELGIGFDPRDPVTLGNAIERLLDDGEALRTYRENAARAAGTLSWERLEPRLQGLIETSLDGTGAAR
jgi:glycosyltransferase involved in cell wall biosynthesis